MCHNPPALDTISFSKKPLIFMIMKQEPLSKDAFCGVTYGRSRRSVEHGLVLMLT